MKTKQQVNKKTIQRKQNILKQKRKQGQQKLKRKHTQKRK